MEIGFVKANPSNLPEVDMFERQSYMSRNVLVVQSEVSGVKMVRSGAESYGDDAVGYVQIKREGPTCIVKGRIVPEHKVHKKPYHVEMMLNETPGSGSKIIHVKCLSCVSAQGFCKHAFAFLCWVERRSYDKACTSVTSYWSKPKLATVGDTARKASDMSKKKKISSRASPPDVDAFKAKVLQSGKSRF
ncbi:hypothetical protein B566_EDAN009174 [Ephemera danica]|nr:hypothetical protein B566_EDAN009174 [Ephemera danica]